MVFLFLHAVCMTSSDWLSIFPREWGFLIGLNTVSGEENGAVTHSLFHQILGVAFFQFARSLCKIFQQFFSRIIFSFPPNTPGKLVEFCCVFCELDHWACNRILVSQ